MPAKPLNRPPTRTVEVRVPLEIASQLAQVKRSDENTSQFMITALVNEIARRRGKPAT